MRRTLSVILYLIAGMFLVGETLMAFYDPAAAGDGNDPAIKLGMLGLMAGFALIPLGLGMLASPGRRMREIGIVLFVSAIVGAVEFTIIAYMVLMPDTGALFPPGIDRSFHAVGTGFANLLLMGGIGWWLIRRSARKVQG